MPFFIFQTSKVWKATRKTPLKGPTFGANSCHSHHQFLKSFPRLAPFLWCQFTVPHSASGSVFGSFLFCCSERCQRLVCVVIYKESWEYWVWLDVNSQQYTQDSTHFPPCLEVQDCTESQENRYITFWWNWFHFKHRGLPLPFGGHLFVSGVQTRLPGGLGLDHFGKAPVFFRGTGSFQFTMPTPLAEVSMASEVSSRLWGGGTCWKKRGMAWVPKKCWKMVNGLWWKKVLDI